MPLSLAHASGRPARRNLARFAVVTVFLASVLLAPPAPGTVEEQRQRLPPPAECKDEVEGIWKAQIYDDRFTVWHAFTLEIHRDAKDKTKLDGTIRTEVWHGGPKQEEPGPCRGELHYSVSMKSVGTHIGGQIDFWGTSLKLDQVFCGRYSGYNIDHFTGKIDPKIQEFQSVNNDGGNAVNEPSVFRRIGCWDDPAAASGVKVKPPPLVPSRRAGGCSCS